MRLNLLGISLLLVWCFTLISYGAVSPEAVAATAIALALLTFAAMALLPEPARLVKGTSLFLAATAAVFALQFLPLGFLFPFTTRLRQAHETGTLWPGTAD